jgi:nicotinamide-nucleotide amidase
MEVSIVVIGDELLIGQVVDTNSGDIAKMIAPAGWTVKNVVTVHDDATAIRDAITDALAHADIVLTTGGLGPTKDDITKSTLCDLFGGRLVENSDVLEHVKTVFRKRGLNMNALTATQAMVPDCCKVLNNELGTAPVMWFERDGKVLVSMPGVPFETRYAFSHEVLPRLLEFFGERTVIEHRTVVMVDITESDLAERLDAWEDALPAHMHLAYLPQPGYLRLRLDGVGADKSTLDAELDAAVEWLKCNLAEHLFVVGDFTPEQVLMQELQQRNMTFATAESCTGGNIAHRMTMLPGVSEVFNGGVVSYSNEVKMAALGVDASALATYGAVSEPVARQMAEGARSRLLASCAVATSGIAGPGGGSAEKPVGTVCMAFSTPNGTVSATLHFPGDRGRVIDRATTTALVKMVQWLRSQD